MTALSMTQASRLFRIYPNSRKALTAWDKAEIITCPYDVKQAAQGIKWALQTGRLAGGVELTIRQMSTYQTLKLLVDVTNGTSNMNDVPRWLNHNLRLHA